LLPRVASPSLSWSSDPLYVHHGVLRTTSAARRERAAFGYDGHTRRGTVHHGRSRLRFDAVFRMSD
jgi:hypothetical protein